MAPLFVDTDMHSAASRTLASSHFSSKHRLAFTPTMNLIPAAAEALRTRIAKARPPRAVFILDWDDTCCATSFLERNGCMANLDSCTDQFIPEQTRLLRVLETRVLSLLKTAVRLGTVLIVTNAGDGWVELSSSRFLPAVRAFLHTNHNRVKIVSARARYVNAYREHPLQWKALTFADELRIVSRVLASPAEPLHVVVIGDSVGDQYAAHVAANSLTSTGMPIVLKVVKFLERPTIDQLCTELAVLLDHILAMVSHRGSFDVSMYKEPTAPSPHHQTQQVPAHYQRPRTTVSSKAVADQRTSGSLTPTSAIPNASVEAHHTTISPASAMAIC